MTDPTVVQIVLTVQCRSQGGGERLENKELCFGVAVTLEFGEKPDRPCDKRTVTLPSEAI